MVTGHGPVERAVRLWLPVGFFLIVALFPFYWMAVTSLKPNQELYNRKIMPLIVYHPTLKHYVDLLTETNFLTWTYNTMLVAVISTAKLYEVQKYCSLTNHMWDGFWFLANAKSFNALPKDVQAVIAKHFNQSAIEQRADIRKLNESLEGELKTKGLTFNKPETESFRLALKSAGFYTEWRDKFGPEAWALLEKYAGTLG